MNVYVHTNSIKIKQDVNKYTETTDVIRTCCTVSAIAAQTVLSMQKCNHLFTSTSSFQLLFVIFSELMNHVCQTDFMFDLFDFFESLIDYSCIGLKKYVLHLPFDIFWFTW